MESEQATPLDSMKDVVRSSMKVPEFDKHLKKAGGHIGRNVVEITIKMKTIVRKPLMIKITSQILQNHVTNITQTYKIYIINMLHHTTTWLINLVIQVHRTTLYV